MNGIAFEVGENLAAALVNIRGLESAGEKPRALWIDAICINQSDIAERNRQVRLMPSIYAKAQMVLIWLGLKFPFQIHCNIEAGLPMEIPKHRETNGVLHGPIDNHRIEELCGREYWKRLWIVQEIGKARHLRIHYNSLTIEWDRFIENVKSHDGLAGNIPSRLAAQVRGPYGGGLYLSNLLRSNHSALCKDPRDKIYGLLGLAVDVDEGFPIDYSKSLFEVFTDTIFFLNRDQTTSQHDILEMSRLMARVLGGGRGLKSDEPAGGFCAGDISHKSADAQVRSLCVSGRLAGRITHIGPLHCDIIARTQKSTEWKTLIRSSVSDSILRPALIEQSDLFLEMLERFDETSQRTIFAFDRKIWWTESQQPSLQKFMRNYGVDMFASQLADSSPSGCRLFLLQPLSLEHTASWMGLAPPGTQVGDFICHIPSMERAVIVRQSQNISTGQHTPAYEIFGCAGLARDRDAAREVMRGVVRQPSGLFAVGNPSAPAEMEQFNIHMDIHAALEISC